MTAIRWRFLTTAVVVAFVGLVYFPLWVFRPGGASLGGWGSDHYSHTSSAIAFLYLGFSINSEPIEKILVPVDSLEAALFAGEHGIGVGELFEHPRRKDGPKLPINWSTFPRPYPPGCMLYATPEAVARSINPTLFCEVNRFTICKYLAAAMLAIWLLGQSMLTQATGRIAKIIDTFGFLVYSQELVFWSLSGFYDAVSIVFLLLSVAAYRSGKWPHVMLWYAMAFFCHFRALWLAPICGVALWQAWRDARNDRIGYLQHNAWIFGVAVAASCAALFAFIKVLPWTHKLPLSNEFTFAQVWSSPAKFAIIGSLVFILGILLVLREYVVAGTALFALLVILATTQVQFWHCLFLIPICAMPAHARRKLQVVRLSLLAFFVFASVLFFRNPVLDLKLLHGLWTSL